MSAKRLLEPSHASHVLRLVIASLFAGLVHCGADVRPVTDVTARDAAVTQDSPPSEDAEEPPLEDVFFAPLDASVSDAQAPTGAPYPVILHHGFAGFRDIGPINYYFNVANDLRARGERVYEAEVAPFDTPATRAGQLARVVDRVLAETHAAKVVLIAHSQGGLDARYMISSLAYGDRVAALVTVSTPHRGTRMADATLGFIPGATAGFINAIATAFGWTYNEARTRSDLRGALVGLSERESVSFNNLNVDDPRVTYWSWAGRSNRRTGELMCRDGRNANETFRLDDVVPPLFPFAVFLEQGDPLSNVNDGMVTVASARWGTFMGCVPADHFDEVG
ncbi:MAG: alpha/beta fold hydrolase, partial [Deltaproteobacteria bacterium]|nr:alpha/beta fold hydrolase [Deltaproteobacteria bacterium]